MKYSDILVENGKMRPQRGQAVYRVGVISNVVIFQLKEILEHTLRLSGIPVVVEIGQYDNVLQESERLATQDAVVFFWELGQTLPGAFHKRYSLGEGELNALFEKLSRELDFVFDRLKSTPLIVFNTFSAGLVDAGSPILENRLELLARQLNVFISQKKPANVVLFDIDRFLRKVSTCGGHDLKNYYFFRMPYKIDFLSKYAYAVRPIFLSLCGRARKVLVMDCDNTLWRGIVGEDGLDRLEMSEHTPEGNIFRQVQALMLVLKEKGALLALASKNDFADVAHVLAEHPDMLLCEKDFVALRVNWAEKGDNIREIAAQLNLGLDSFVFIDDSDFEVASMRQHLPEVASFKVPERIHEYPGFFTGIMEFFYSTQVSSEDFRRTEMYREQSSRSANREQFASIEEYLISLGLKMRFFANMPDLASRLAQMTQKTNQFNLTTRRFSEAEVVSYMGERDARIFAFQAEDKFGDLGIVGAAFVNVAGDGCAMIDNLLMSCRAIGRGFELAFFDSLVRFLADEGIGSLHAEYCKTPKNGLVARFYDELGFRCIVDDGGCKRYLLDLAGYQPKGIKYIEVLNGNKS